MFLAKLRRCKSKARLGVGIHRGTARARQESLSVRLRAQLSPTLRPYGL